MRYYQITEETFLLKKDKARPSWIQPLLDEGRLTKRARYAGDPCPGWSLDFGRPHPMGSHIIEREDNGIPEVCIDPPAEPFNPTL